METKLIQFQKRASSFPERAKTFIVKDERTLLQANVFVQIITAMEREIKDFFKPLKDKVNAARQALIDQEKDLLFPLEESKRIVNPQIGSYIFEQRRLKEEAEEKARKAENPFDETVSEKEIIPIPKVTKLKGMGVREEWKWEAEDINKIPKEWWCLDEFKINKHVREFKEKTKIPGIRVFKKPTVLTGFQRR